LRQIKRNYSIFAYQFDMEKTTPNNGWLPIATAPGDVELELSIFDDGEYHALAFPCKRDGSSWRDVGANRPMPLQPTHWRPWSRPHTSPIEDAMKEPGLDNRHRDKDGEISRKHGNTLVGTLRKTYGPSFATGHSDLEKLADVLRKMDEPSLTKLRHDHDAGRLHDIAKK
jgi:hypothetical protein